MSVKKSDFKRTGGRQYVKGCRQSVPGKWAIVTIKPRSRIVRDIREVHSDDCCFVSIVSWVTSIRDKWLTL